MFLGERQPLMAAVIMAADERRSARPRSQRLRRCSRPTSRRSCASLDGRPVTVRLLDPPLHEFLPHPETLPTGSPERRRVEQLQESNPMLGTRGVRLGLLYPAPVRDAGAGPVRAPPSACRAATSR